MLFLTCRHHRGVVKQIHSNAIDHNSLADWHRTCRWQYDQHVRDCYIQDLTASPSDANCNPYNIDTNIKQMVLIVYDKTHQSPGAVKLLTTPGHFQLPVSLTAQKTSVIVQSVWQNSPTQSSKCSVFPQINCFLTFS